MCYSQLAEVGQVKSITVNHIDLLSDKVPLHIIENWNVVYEDPTVDDNIHSFPSFMRFMEGRRSAVACLAERQCMKNSVLVDDIKVRTQNAKTVRTNAVTSQERPGR